MVLQLDVFHDHSNNIHFVLRSCVTHGECKPGENTLESIGVQDLTGTGATKSRVSTLENVIGQCKEDNSTNMTSPAFYKIIIHNGGPWVIIPHESDEVQMS